MAAKRADDIYIKKMGVEAADSGVPYHLKNATNDARRELGIATEGEFHVKKA